MKKAERKAFRAMLIDWKETLLCRADDTIAGLLDWSVTSADHLDQATLVMDRDFALRIRDRESRLIRKINAALQRIEEGTFGVCETCGGEIAVARLRARPVATHCIDCKRVMETLERMIDA